MPPDDYNFEIAETKPHFLPEIKVTIKLFKFINPKIEKNIFKCADFWLSKGYLIQTSKQGGQKQADANNVALDYYLSGVKINPESFPCVYNVACSYYMEQKYLSAKKWFDLAAKIDPYN